MCPCSGFQMCWGSALSNSFDAMAKRPGFRKGAETNHHTSNQVDKAMVPGLLIVM